jgi:PD-(D/E)XK nuclease superfamily protein
MASLKMKGDLAELKVATDLIERGYKIAIPYGEDSDFDLIFSRGDAGLERVQVKYTKSNGEFILIRCRSHALTNGKIKRTKHYTAATIDWLAVYDRTTDRCYYLPATELGEGRTELVLRLTPPKNNQRARIRYAVDYMDPEPSSQTVLATRLMMEPAGLEPATSWMQTTRSPN